MNSENKRMAKPSSLSPRFFCYPNFTKKTLAIVCALGLSVATQTSYAQIGSSSVKGIIAAQKTPQAGVEVIVKNVDNGFIYKTTTLKDGTYVVKGLNPGHYQISLQQDAQQKPLDVVLAVGQNYSLNFEIAKPSDEKVEEVIVTGTKAIANVGGEIGTNISQQQINRLPQNTRNFLAFTDLAPGVQFTQGDDGSTRIKSGAQGANSINVFIDGVGQKNYVTGGGVTGQDSSRGNPFPQSAIAEYKVITQNYSAEYDQLSSAAVVAVTASGTNELHGSVFYDYTDQGMREMRPSEIKDNKKVVSKQGQYGVSVGGPIIQDKMHFFFAYEAKNTADPKEIEVMEGKTKEDLPTQYQSLVGGVPAKFQEDLYFGKIDLLLNDAQKLEFTAKIRNETELTGIGGADSLSYGTDKVNDESRYDLRHTWSSNTWVNDAHITIEDSTFNPRAHTRSNGIQFKNNDDKTLLNAGGGQDYQNKGQKGWGIQEDFTYTALQNHQLKTGFKFKSIELRALEQQPYNAQYSYNLDYLDATTFSAQTSQPYSVEWGAPLQNVGDGGLKSKNKQFGIYVQDDWTLTDKFILNAGVRWDYEESDAYLDYKTPQDVVDGIANWDAINKSNIHIQDFVSNGNNRESFKNGFQPRLGFTYTLDEEHNAQLFGGIGRAYDRNLFDYLQVESTKATYPTYKIYFESADPAHTCNLADDNCKTWDAKYLTAAGLAQITYGNPSAGREVDLLNNKLRTPYSDQFSFGVRGVIDEVWQAEVSISHVVSKDGFAWMIANRHDDGSFFPSPSATWGVPWGLGIPGLGNTLIGVNALQTKTNSLFVKLDKPKAESSYGLSLAYTYSVGKSNLKDGEHYALDYPSISGYGWIDTNALPTHRLVVAFMSDLPGGIDFTAKLNLHSVENYIGTNCRAGWDMCRYSSFKPNVGFLGFKQLDLAFSKNFVTNYLSQGSSLTARFDVLNLTNAINHGGYNDWFGTPDEQDPNFGKPQDSLAGPPLTLKFGLTWDW